MSKSVEAVVAEALQRLESTGRLNVAAYAAAYPEYADELLELLPMMQSLHEEKQWLKVEGASRTFALDLFGQLADQPAPGTVGHLFIRERTEAGLSAAEQARRSGLPAGALDALARDRTPVESLHSNAALKDLAVRVAAPFAALVKEVRRLLSVESLSASGPQAVFTRDRETSSAEEQKALLDKVREAARKPPEEPPK